MMNAKSEAIPTPESIAKYVKQNARKALKSSAMMMHHEGEQEIVREDDYKGHHVVVKTMYHITVDGQDVTGHIMLTNQGQVQYHGLPNHSFDSTIDLVRALIDNFPEDFDKKKPAMVHGGMANVKMGGSRKHSMHMAKKAAKSSSKTGTGPKKKSAAKPKGAAGRGKSK
jgi:hypothetical protein